jgi:putative nucleotidyltransferase with HDIG domain
MSLAMNESCIMDFISASNVIFRDSDVADIPREVLVLCNEVSKAKGGALVYLMNLDRQWIVESNNEGEPLQDYFLNNHDLWMRFLEYELQKGGGWFFHEEPESEWEALFTWKGMHFKSIFTYPIKTDDQWIGIGIWIDPAVDSAGWMKILIDRLFIDYSVLKELEAAKQRTDRLELLVDLLGKIGSTLDRDQILNIIVEDAQKVLNSEAVSMFLVDEKSTDNVLYLSSNQSRLGKEQIRVPAGEGIIGHVIKTGEIIIVNDAPQDKRHYNKVDKRSGMSTKTLLAVPLQSRTLVLGGERGVKKEKIVGGLEAMNKQDGFFSQEDAKLLGTLARETATVLEIADLYNEVNQLVISVIRALTAAIDAKDPYTEGHSQRVSKFSQEIARELNLSQDLIYHIQIGCLLHDVGKIGIPDAIIGKTTQLSAEEYEKVKKHPSIGVKILTEVRMPKIEMLAVAEHHERPDGSGYPVGFHNEQISLAGRIVAVADVFDAMTSDRPYRGALPVMDVLDYLRSNTGNKFDDEAVNALERAFKKGLIKTQKDEQHKPGFAFSDVNSD